MPSAAKGWFTGPATLLGGGIAAVVLWGGGPRGLLLLALFVVSGSLLSGGDAAPRRAAQVLANGWTAAAGAALARVAPDMGLAFLAGGLAAAQADTWATEIGRRYGGIPVLITTRAPVPPGASGGVTRVGTVAGVVGGAVTGAALLASGYHSGPSLAVALSGGAGMVLDSLLGATVQIRYRCARCHSPWDTPFHCGAPAPRAGGRRWITNDVVNALATGAGAGLAAGAIALA